MSVNHGCPQHQAQQLSQYVVRTCALGAHAKASQNADVVHPEWYLDPHLVDLIDENLRRLGTASQLCRLQSG